MKRFGLFITGLLLLLYVGVTLAADIVSTDVEQPGTQPGEVGNLESPDKCDNCHGGYDSAVEPAFNWRGSMMAQAGRDPIFWATLAIAEQDFDGVGDMCIRCHSTTGWYGDRSTPTDGSGLAASDSDGVDCDTCHKMTNPDNSEYLGVMNSPFIANDGLITPTGYYGTGMLSLWDGAEKLGPYSTTSARHQFMQSEFHRSKDFCGSCHDVSNPVVGDLAPNHGAQSTADPVVASGIPGAPVEDKAAFNNFPYMYGVVERTYSEYYAGLLSQSLVTDYGTLPADLKDGAVQAAYQSAGGDYADGTPRYFTCQTCHMAAVTGAGCNKNGAEIRTDLPLHDMTGGNYWVPDAIQYQDSLGLLRLGGGLTSLQIDALNAGSQRAQTQLDLAASLEVTDNTLKVTNLTGHKLITGYPEGRRMWLNIKWYDSGSNLVREDGEYGDLVVNIDDTPTTVRTILDLDDPNTKIYEAHYGMTQEWASTLIALSYDPELPISYDRLTGEASLTLSQLAGQTSGTEAESFHFALNNTVIKDNRIPPYGFDYDEARKRNALPVPMDQYGGNGAGSTYNYWDEFSLNPPANAVSAEISLMYQPTSWEYIQFLYLGNDGENAFLGSEGDNILDTWLNTGMAEPYVMATTMWSSTVIPCDTPGTPSLVAPANGTTTVDNTPYFDWNTASNANEYQFQLDDNSNFSSPVVDTTTANTFYDPPVLADGTYYWRVRGHNNTASCDEWGEWSSVWQIEIDTTAPTTPTLSSPSDGSTTNNQTPTFNWNASSGSPHQYQLLVDNNAAFDSPEVDQTLSSSQTQYTPSSNLAYGTYHWKVRVRDLVGNWSNWSAVWTVTIEATPTCYGLTRFYIGSGSPPGVSLTNSDGCSPNYYVPGEVLTLTALPASGWIVSSWQGTDDDSSVALTNTLTMPASNHQVTVTYINAPPTCYALTLTHTPSSGGADPTAVPASSSGCAEGTYVVGEAIDLTAYPNPSWGVSGWNGTDNDSSTNLTNTVTMPSNNHTASLIYALIPTIETLTNTSFETYIPAGWQDGRQIELYDGPDCGAGNARTGNCAVHFEGDGTSKRIFMRYKLAGVAGDNFMLTLYRKGLNVPAADGAYVKTTLYYNDGTEEVFKVNLDTGTISTWEQFTLPFTASKDYKRVNLDLFYKKASGTMWLDDISMKRNSSAEMLENTSFEIYKPDDYVLSVNLDPNEGPDCSGSNAHSGTCSVHFDGDATNKRLLMRAKKAGSAGDFVTISIWRKGVSVPAASGAYVKVEVFYTDGTSDIIRMDLDTGNLAVWEEFTTGFTAAKDYKRFNIDLFYKKASGTMWLDDISLLVP